MKVTRKDEDHILLELTNVDALRLVALIRETCFGALLHGFETRVGSTPEEVGRIGSELNKALEDLSVVE